MLQRCENPKNKNYHNYGGRGLTVCARWHDFALFLADMGTAPAGLELERKDNERGYSPENCRWATDKEQANNQRKTIRITFDGQTKPLTTWAAEKGIKVATLYRRIVLRKEPPEVAFR